jgi:hypothetical protein
MAPKTSKIPLRVGFTPTPLRQIREPGTRLAATRKKAAEEMSPGITRSRGRRLDAGGLMVYVIT